MEIIEKETIRRMVVMGCDLEVSAQTVGWSSAELRRQFREDPHFARAIAEAEGKAELHHMRSVHEATKDEKHWRASTWWLDRRTKDRRSRRDANQLTAEGLSDFLEDLGDLVFNFIADEQVRDQLIIELLTRARELDARNANQLLALVDLDGADGDADAPTT